MVQTKYIRYQKFLCTWYCITDRGKLEVGDDFVDVGDDLVDVDVHLVKVAVFGCRLPVLASSRDVLSEKKVNLCPIEYTLLFPCDISSQLTTYLFK